MRGHNSANEMRAAESRGAPGGWVGILAVLGLEVLHEPD